MHLRTHLICFFHLKNILSIILHRLSLLVSLCFLIVFAGKYIHSIINMMLQLRSLARFCFFNNQISEKYGKPCCRYNQDGKPLSQTKVKAIYTDIGQFIKGWKLREEGKRLVRHFYVEDYPLALKFLEEVVKIDANEFKQCPTYKVENGQLLTLELYSITLKGLSMVDFQFAMRINNISHQKFSMFPIENEKEYRLEASMVRMERQAKDFDKMLEDDKKNWKKQENKDDQKNKDEKTKGKQPV